MARLTRTHLNPYTATGLPGEILLIGAVLRQALVDARRAVRRDPRDKMAPTTSEQADALAFLLDTERLA